MTGGLVALILRPSSLSNMCICMTFKVMFVSTNLREKLLIEAVGFSFHKHFAFPEGVTLEHLTETLAKVFFASFFIGRKYYFSNSFKLSFSWLDLF